MINVAAAKHPASGSSRKVFTRPHTMIPAHRIEIAARGPVDSTSLRADSQGNAGAVVTAVFESP